MATGISPGTNTAPSGAAAGVRGAANPPEPRSRPATGEAILDDAGTKRAGSTAETSPAAHERSAAGSPPEEPLALFVCSSGGHLAQLLPLREWTASHRVRWVTFDTADAMSALAGEDVVVCHYPTTRNIPNLVRNLWLSVRLMRQERPALIVSTGAGVAVPFFVMGRLLGVPTVFIEVFDRIDSATLTGRLVRPFTTRYLVQWDEQKSLYPGAVNVGPLL
ncbi:MAG: PssD/Cps14F family polysaccharide biosynthesis glycosyltransferase [Actinomycetales bacterium]